MKSLLLFTIVAFMAQFSFADSEEVNTETKQFFLKVDGLITNNMSFGLIDVSGIIRVTVSGVVKDKPEIPCYLFIKKYEETTEQDQLSKGVYFELLMADNVTFSKQESGHLSTSIGRSSQTDRLIDSYRSFRYVQSSIHTLTDNIGVARMHPLLPDNYVVTPEATENTVKLRANKSVTFRMDGDSRRPNYDDEVSITFEPESFNILQADAVAHGLGESFSCKFE